MPLKKNFLIHPNGSLPFLLSVFHLSGTRQVKNPTLPGLSCSRSVLKIESSVLTKHINQDGNSHPVEEESA